MKEEMLFNLLCQYLDADPKEIRGPSRKREITHKRQIIAYALCESEATNWTTHKTGKVVNRNRTAIIHSVQTIENEIKRDEDLDEIVWACFRLLNIGTSDLFLKSKTDDLPDNTQPDNGRTTQAA